MYRLIGILHTMYPGFRDPVPADKIMSLLIVQAITSFYMGDYESGVHYLHEIKTEYASGMSKLSPTMKKIARDIISALDLIRPSDQDSFPQETHSPETPSSSEVDETQAISDRLEEILRRRRAQRGS